MTPQECVDAILDEMESLTRAEWMDIARRSKPGAVGFSPMRQLQQKIRDNPIHFGPSLLAFLVAPIGGAFERLIPWPKPAWKVTRQYTPSGWMRFKDYYPYRKIDPILDELEARMDEHGAAHALVQQTSRRLIDECLNAS